MRRLSCRCRSRNGAGARSPSADCDAADLGRRDPASVQSRRHRGARLRDPRAGRGAARTRFQRRCLGARPLRCASLQRPTGIDSGEAQARRRNDRGRRSGGDDRLCRYRGFHPVVVTHQVAVELVDVLNTVFSRSTAWLIARAREDQDDRRRLHGGGGLPARGRSRRSGVARLALDMRDASQVTASAGRRRLSSGSASTPVRSSRRDRPTKFIYDVWGDTVNTASRMESHGARPHPR